MQCDWQVPWAAGITGGYCETQVGGLVVSRRRGFVTGTHMFKRFFVGEKKEKKPSVAEAGTAPDGRLQKP